MTDVMNLERLISLAAWLCVIIRIAPAVVRTICGRPRYYDPIWSLLWALATCIVGFNARWLFAPENVLVWSLLQLMVIFCAVGALVVVQRYEHD